MSRGRRKVVLERAGGEDAASAPPAFVQPLGVQPPDPKLQQGRWR